jgi:glycosyltransferase involved in cell wall biosynthesis
VCHVINNLQVGGAETMLYKLLSRLDPAAFDCHVVSLIERGPISKKIEALGIPVVTCGMRRGLPGPISFARLCGHLRRIEPDVVQTWIFHSDLLGGLASKLILPRTPVVWNVRQSTLEAGVDKQTTIWAAKLCAHLSAKLPARVIVNSQASRTVNQAFGYAADRLIVIPNGFDTILFRASNTARLAVRAELGLAPETPLVGIIGRYHPHKDHPTFLRAARRIAAARPDTHFLLCGPGLDGSNRQLKQLIADCHVASANVHLLGSRDDMPSVQSSLDVAVSSSLTEGFPNAIGEAMACGVPCVVTDTGGSPELVGNTGRIVPRQNPEALAAACLELLTIPDAQRRQLGARARHAVEQHFSLQRVAQQYAELWQHVADRTVLLHRPQAKAA